jgi:hypothetical protein
MFFFKTSLLENLDFMRYFVGVYAVLRVRNDRGASHPVFQGGTARPTMGSTRPGTIAILYLLHDITCVV